MTSEEFLIRNSTTVNYVDPEERYIPLITCLGLARALEKYGVEVTIKKD